MKNWILIGLIRAVGTAKCSILKILEKERINIIKQDFKGMKFVMTRFNP